MKKKNLKSLNLNKKSISSLNDKSLKGGASTGCGTSITPTTPVINFTEGDCVDTLGDDHCWTPLKTVGW